MQQTARDTVDALIAKDTWTAENCEELRRTAMQMGDAPNRLRAILGQLESQTDEVKGAAALRIGMVRYLLCRFGAALEALGQATDNKERHYYQALCYKQLNQVDAASQEFERAGDRGWDPDEIWRQLLELQIIAGQIDEAAKALGKQAAKMGESAEYYYLRGRIDELAGRAEQAAEAYTKAHELNGEHEGALFRLAYLYDLHGDEEQAVELYQQCISRPPIHANALLNLAVLHEDAGRYEQAIRCLRSVLATNPTHARARLFLKDAQASTTMYYDEDQAKRIAKRNAVLDIPVTDFELSVRARNCLKKMNIRTLGDLVRTTEPELLSYKNFGETSLKEIKDMLAAKGLRLGQELEETGDYGNLLEMTAPEPVAASVENEGVLATPIDRVEFSVRARRALESLRIRTLGDLAAKSEAELMTCRNFGQTSLNEVRQRLAEYGLELREPTA